MREQTFVHQASMQKASLFSFIAGFKISLTHFQRPSKDLFEYLKPVKDHLNAVVFADNGKVIVRNVGIQERQ